jgi:hypothetical protein
MFVMYPSSTKGAGVAEAARRVQCAPDLRLVDQRRSSLLVEGSTATVRSLARDIGWSAEPNRSVSPDVTPRG